MILDDRLPFSKVCSFCKHLEPLQKRTCTAFPDGIPDEIWEGRNWHKETYPGDRGIQFEAKDISA